MQRYACPTNKDPEGEPDKVVDGGNTRLRALLGICPFHADEEHGPDHWPMAM